jgi:ParB family chromosome partitioning protein
LIKKGLGKGLGALISETSVEEDTAAIRWIAIDQIQRNPYQPRQRFDPEKLAELAESIRVHGILQPVLLRKRGVDDYELIAGERRFRAAQEAGLEVIPALVRDITDLEMLEIAIIENVQREDINPADAALAYQRLHTEFKMPQEVIAQKVGKARSTITNTIRLLTLPEPVLEALRQGIIGEGHARALLQVFPDFMEEAYEILKNGHLTVRQTEELVRDVNARFIKQPAALEKKDPKEKTPSVPRPRDPNVAAIESQLQARYRTKVTIKNSGGTGRIELEFYCTEELEGLIEQLLRRPIDLEADY